MTVAFPKISKSITILLIKIIIVIGASYYIYHQLTNNTSLNFFEFLAFVNQNQSLSIANVLFLIILTTLNWYFEIIKWQTLVSNLTSISSATALRQSLAGLTASLLTPNRIGDYGAKALYFRSALQKRILLLNLIGNMAQMTVTVGFGCIGLYLVQKHYNTHMYSHTIFMVLTIALLLVLLIFYAFQQSILQKKVRQIGKLVTFLKQLSIRSIALTFGLSLLRYVVFSFQFYSILNVFGAELTYFEAIPAIFGMYLLASVVPSLTIFDVVIKTSAAVFIFNFLSIDQLLVLSTSMLMWLLNVVMPSIAGCYFVLNFSMAKSKY